jgi:hypothetical protein
VGDRYPDPASPEGGVTTAFDEELWGGFDAEPPDNAQNPFADGTDEHAAWEREERVAREQVRQEREGRILNEEVQRQYRLLVARQRAVEQREADLSPASVASEKVKALCAEMLTLDQLDQLPPVEWLVKHILPIDTQGQINGQPGTFKSFIALDLALHIAAGRPDWHGHRIKRHGLVLYMAAEGGRGIRRRIRAWSIRHQVPADQIRLRVLPRAVQAYEGNEWSTFVAASQRLPPVLVIVDTQARVTVGAEENSARDMGVVVKRVEELREATSACVLLVHHQGHAGGRGRGSSAVWGANDFELALTRPDDRTKREVSVEVAKQKDDEDGQSINFDMVTVELGEYDEDGEPVTSLVPVWREPADDQDEAPNQEPPKVNKEAARKAKLDEEDEAIYEVVCKLIADGKPTSVRTIRAMAQMGHPKVSDALTRLVMAGRLVGDPAARDSQAFTLPVIEEQLTLTEESQ